MAPATAAFHQAAVTSHLTHDGNPDLRRHVSNAVLIPNTRGDKLAKDSKHSPRKIDLAVAALMAFHRAAELKPSKPRVVDMNEEFARMIREGTGPGTPAWEGVLT